jgi:hypothetical protein
MVENLPGQFVCLVMNKPVVLIVEISGSVIEIRSGVPPPYGQHFKDLVVRVPGFENLYLFSTRSVILLVFVGKLKKFVQPILQGDTISLIGYRY